MFYKPAREGFSLYKNEVVVGNLPIYSPLNLVMLLGLEYIFYEVK